MYFFCFISPLILISTLMELYLNNAPSLTLKLSFHCPPFQRAGLILSVLSVFQRQCFRAGLYDVQWQRFKSPLVQKI